MGDAVFRSPTRSLPLPVLYSSTYDKVVSIQRFLVAHHIAENSFRAKL